MTADSTTAGGTTTAGGATMTAAAPRSAGEGCRRPRERRGPGGTGTIRAVGAALLATVLALAGALTATTPATAEGAGAGGWVRLTHLSPDTPEVNVSLTSLADSTSVLELSEVGYGAVSEYTRVEPGTYVAAMTPAGGDASSEPAISQSVTVEDGRAYTVAAVGRNAELTGTVLTDDLTTPGEDAARIRLLQASVSAPTVTVTAAGGPTLAEDARFGTATGYAEVPTGVWTVTVTPTEGTAEPVTTELTAEPSSVNTVVVLDSPSGDGLEVRVVQDASGVRSMPAEGTGVETGGGGTASTPGANGTSTGVVGGLALAALAGLLLTFRHAGRRLPGRSGG